MLEHVPTEADAAKSLNAEFTFTAELPEIAESSNNFTASHHQMAASRKQSSFLKCC